MKVPFKACLFDIEAEIFFHKQAFGPKFVFADASRFPTFAILILGQLAGGHFYH